MLHAVKLSEFDLNHVRALHALLEEAHVARAARRLAITPAAASNALARLRRDFEDPLLVRVGRTFTRSALAEALRAPARAVIAAAERLVDVAVPFDPKTEEGTFVIFAADRIAEVLVEPLDRLLQKRAPLANLHLRTFSAPTSQDERGLFITPSCPPGFLAEALFQEEYVCVLRAQHPLLKGAFSTRRFAAAEHVLVAPRGLSDRGVVDVALAAHGLTRRVARVVTSFAPALALVERSDRITTLPSSFAFARSVSGKLTTRKPPLQLEPITMLVAWHPQIEDDPRYTWFRGLLHEVVREIGLHDGAGTNGARRAQSRAAPHEM